MKALLTTFTLLLIVFKTQGLSQDEKDVIRKIKENLLSISSPGDEKNYIEGWLNKYPDTLIGNWLEHRDGNGDAVVEGLRKMLAWRRVNNIDNTLLWNSPADVNQTLYYKITGFSPEGHPVIYADLGNWQIRQLVQMGYRKDIIKYSIQMMEIALRDMEIWRKDPINGDKVKNSDTPSKFILLGNLQGLTVGQVSSIRALGTIATILQVLETNYPLIHHKAYAINAPAYFSIVVDTIKGALSSKAFEILQVFGSNADDWRPEIEKFIPKNAIPTSLGGNAIV